MSTLADLRPGLEGAGARRGRPWRAGPWLFGAALLIAVVLVTLHWAEHRELARLVERSSPEWLLAAAVLQACTYLLQAGVWKVVLDKAGRPVSPWELYKLSVAKLFVDQAIPSAGISGTLLIVRGLERRGIDRGPVMACVVVETITNSLAFILALAVALGLVAWLGHVSPIVWTASAGFMAFGCALTAAVVLLSRGRRLRLPGWLERTPGIRLLLGALAEAPPALAHHPRLLIESTAQNFGIHLLDAATLWTLLHAMGVSADPTRVFAAFMLSTLARTVGVVPGGLGTFEAASIGTLSLMKVPVAAALAATLLFRGFSFWVPLWPGLWLSRAELREQRRRSA